MRHNLVMGRSLSLKLHWPNQTFSMGPGLSDSSHWPGSSRCCGVHHQDDISNTTPFDFCPLLPLLEQKKVFLGPSVQKKVCHILDLFPAASRIKVGWMKNSVRVFSSSSWIGVRGSRSRGGPSICWTEAPLWLQHRLHWNWTVSSVKSFLLLVSLKCFFSAVHVYYDWTHWSSRDAVVYRWRLSEDKM